MQQHGDYAYQVEEEVHPVSVLSGAEQERSEEDHRTNPEGNPPLLKSLVHIVTLQFMICIVLATGLVLLNTFSPAMYRDMSTHLGKLITEDDGFATDTAILVDRLQPSVPKTEQPGVPAGENDSEEIAIPPAEGDGIVDLSAQTTEEDSVWTKMETEAGLWSPTPKELLQLEAKASVIPANAIVTKVSYVNPLALPLDLPMVVTSAYGEREHPITGEWSFHTGVDLRAPEGEPIKAPLAGEVISAGEGKTLGNYVKLRHPDGSMSLYGHCSKLLVKEGDQVKKGAVIAKVGTTGSSTGPHLHLSFLMDGKYVNPGYIFKDVPV